MNIAAVNQKYWKLFKNVNVPTSYLSIDRAICVSNVSTESV